MYSTWTESPEAILAEQSWERLERDLHQRLVQQLKRELAALRQERRQSNAATVVTETTVDAPPAAGATAVPATPPRAVRSAKAPARESARESEKRVIRNSGKTLPPVQIR